MDSGLYKNVSTYLSKNLRESCSGIIRLIAASPKIAIKSISLAGLESDICFHDDKILF